MTWPSRARGRPPRSERCPALLWLLAVVFGFSTLPVAFRSQAARAESASLGLAGAYSLRARGVEAPEWNPATLAWSPRLDWRIASVGARVQNNAFSVDEYNRWNGALWTDEDKEAILARIGEAFEAAFRLSAEGPGVAWRRWAVTTAGRAAGSTTLPGEYAKLLLYGNDPDEVYDLGGGEGEGIAWTEVRLSHARPVGELRVSGLRLPVAAGASVKYLSGLAYGEFTRMEGSLETTSEGIFGRQVLIGRTAEGGAGIAVDVGLVARGPNGWSFSLAARNFPSMLRWSREPRRRTETARADSVTAGEAETDEDLLVTESTEEPIAPFTRALPAALILAAARTWDGWTVEGDLLQGLHSRAGSSTTPRLAAGASRSPWRWLECRAGLALGGEDGPVLAVGTGLALWRVRLDLALATARSLDFSDPHGVTAGASLGLRWER